MNTIIVIENKHLLKGIVHPSHRLQILLFLSRGNTHQLVVRPTSSKLDQIHLHEQRQRQLLICWDPPNGLKHPYRPSWSNLILSPYLKYIVNKTDANVGGYTMDSNSLEGEWIYLSRKYTNLTNYSRKSKFTKLFCVVEILRTKWIWFLDRT